MNIKADVPITLSSASVADEYEGDLSARRTITWTLSFTLKGFIYPNISSGQVIKTIEVNFRIIFKKLFELSCQILWLIRQCIQLIYDHQEILREF